MRVLNVTTVLRAAGIESFIMNMYRHMDRDQVQYDFMVMRNEKEYYDNEICKLGGRKYTISVPFNNTLIRIIIESFMLYFFLRKNKYRIVHIHATTSLRAFYLLAAKMAGVPVRIYHSHSAYVSGKSSVKLRIYQWCRSHITRWATDYFACSTAAAEWVFDSHIISQKKYELMPNGIDVDKFRFNQLSRNEIRQELNINDDFVVAHTGRFLDQKNHSFLIDVFSEIHVQNPNSRLLLLGTGELVKSIQQKVDRLGLSDRVIFLGVRSDVDKILSSADCYVMPSLYEGLPVAAVEAECSGLPCFLSDNITKEVALTSKTYFLPLNLGAKQWAQYVYQHSSDSLRHDESEVIAEHGYDVKEVASKLQSFYQFSVSKNSRR
nr:glycosyltransferase family 1 protein [Bifidobacterium amazonense]